MKNLTRHLLFYMIIAAIIVSLAACSVTASGGTGTTSGTGTTAAQTTETFTYAETSATPTEVVSGGSVEGDTLITLGGSGAEISGSGAAYEDGDVLITASGSYVVSGTLDDGRIIINVAKDEKVTLVLNGASITSADSAAIWVQSADKLTLELADGSVNTVANGGSYTVQGVEDEPGAAIFSKDDLKITGSGTLYVTADAGRGVHTKDDLQIEEATLIVSAEDDGLRGNDSVEIHSGTIIVTAGADGIHSNNETDEGKGYVYIDGGHIEITAAFDGIQAATDLTITNGEFAIVTGGGSANASSKSDSGWGSWGGGRGGMGQQTTAATTTASSDSAKAVKAAGNLTISGGVFLIDSSDDSIHSNGTVVISGGTFDISSGDDGVHADSELTLSGGTITISKSYEGLEAATLNISGGTADITASDDGLNAAGGSDSSSVSGRPGQGSFSTSTGTMTLSGGNVTVNASGDGIDCNGSITMTGGTFVVYGPTDSGNGAMDYDGTFTVTGGAVYAFGSTGMAQGVSSGSQASIFVKLSVSAGSVLKVTDASGNTVCEFTLPKASGCALICTETLVSGASYTFCVNGSSVGTLSAS